MQEKLITEIYHNLIESSELPRKHHLLIERVDITTKQLKKVMNKKNKKKLEQLCKDYEEILALEVDNAFSDGFSFAIKLMAEVYSK